jgi:hypothetical protein
MKHNVYILSSCLSAETTIARVGELFAKEGVQFRTEGLSIFSISTPIALLSFDRTLYSNRNWVGLNPFTFISGIDVRCRLDKSGVTEIVVQVNKFRTFLWVAVWVSSSGLAASAMPIAQGALLFIAVSLAAWFGLVSFLSGYLIKKEISDCLNA